MSVPLKAFGTALSAAVMVSFLASAPAQAASGTVCSRLRNQAVALMQRVQATAVGVGLVVDARPACRISIGALQPAGRPMTIDTKFHMASVSKTFTAIAVMKLVGEGRVDLDRTVAAYIPDFSLADAAYATITVRQLLTHTSGMPDVPDDQYGWDRPVFGGEALHNYVLSLRHMKLLTPPGSAFSYSNIGYEILGDLVAHVGHRSFDDYEAEMVLAPAGITQSSFIYPRQDAGGYAQPLVPAPGGGAKVSPIYPYNREHGPSSTLHSSARDMTQWMTILLGPSKSRDRVLSHAAWTAMRVPLAQDLAREHPDEASPGVQMGLGWFLYPFGNHKLMLHPGEDDGFQSMLVIDPVSHAGVVVMLNSSLRDPLSGDDQREPTSSTGWRLAIDTLSELGAEPRHHNRKTR